MFYCHGVNPFFGYANSHAAHKFNVRFYRHLFKNPSFWIIMECATDIVSSNIVILYTNVCLTKLPRNDNLPNFSYFLALSQSSAKNKTKPIQIQGHLRIFPLHQKSTRKYNLWLFSQLYLGIQNVSLVVYWWKINIHRLNHFSWWSQFVRK